MVMTPPEAYTFAQPTEEEIQPWSFVDLSDTLKRHYQDFDIAELIFNLIVDKPQLRADILTWPCMRPDDGKLAHEYFPTESVCDNE